MAACSCKPQYRTCHDDCSNPEQAANYRHLGVPTVLLIAEAHSKSAQQQAYSTASTKQNTKRVQKLDWSAAACNLRDNRPGRLCHAANQCCPHCHAAQTKVNTVRVCERTCKASELRLSEEQAGSLQALMQAILLKNTTEYTSLVTDRAIDYLMLSQYAGRRSASATLSILWHHHELMQTELWPAIAALNALAAAAGAAVCLYTRYHSDGVNLVRSGSEQCDMHRVTAAVIAAVAATKAYNNNIADYQMYRCYHRSILQKSAGCLTTRAPQQLDSTIVASLQGEHEVMTYCTS
eukprot:6577-Heterococcus_DN1.PRE.3